MFSKSAQSSLEIVGVTIGVRQGGGGLWPLETVSQKHMTHARRSGTHLDCPAAAAAAAAAAATATSLVSGTS